MPVIVISSRPSGSSRSVCRMISFGTLPLEVQFALVLERRCPDICDDGVEMIDESWQLLVTRNRSCRRPKYGVSSVSNINY